MGKGGLTLQVKFIPEHFCYTISLIFILDKSKYHNFCLSLCCALLLSNPADWRWDHSLQDSFETLPSWKLSQSLYFTILHYSNAQRTQNQKTELPSYLKFLTDSTLYFSRGPLKAMKKRLASSKSI